MRNYTDDYIITQSNHQWDGSWTTLFNGTEEELMAYIVKMMKDECMEYIDRNDEVPESIYISDEFDSDMTNIEIGYIVFRDSHTSYTVSNVDSFAATSFANQEMMDRLKTVSAIDYLSECINERTNEKEGE